MDKMSYVNADLMNTLNGAQYKHNKFVVFVNDMLNNIFI